MTRRDWNPLYILRWDAADGPHQTDGTSRDIHAAAPRINQLGDRGDVWNITVIDETGTDVTGRFFHHLEAAA
ncbi:hypothetical protein [Streptomyces sp. NPDC086519]|uniref:hypothetical protein n=1 Tax=Streptomyces sp. NPDC086519 TaxID=3154863 RepID=UPI003432A2A3